MLTIRPLLAAILERGSNTTFWKFMHLAMRLFSSSVSLGLSGWLSCRPFATAWQGVFPFKREALQVEHR